MKLKFIRHKQFADMVRAYRIFIDGKHVDNIRYGQKKELEIPEGKHEIFLKIDWCTSNTVNIDVEKNKKTLMCYNRFAGWKMFTVVISLYYITLGRKSYLTLERNKRTET